MSSANGIYHVITQPVCFGLKQDMPLSENGVPTVLAKEWRK
jgi:hypothetical protein